MDSHVTPSAGARTRVIKTPYAVTVQLFF